MIKTFITDAGVGRKNGYNELKNIYAIFLDLKKGREYFKYVSQLV